MSYMIDRQLVIVSLFLFSGIYTYTPAGHIHFHRHFRSSLVIAFCSQSYEYRIRSSIVDMVVLGSYTLWIANQLIRITVESMDRVPPTPRLSPPGLPFGPTTPSAAPSGTTPGCATPFTPGVASASGGAGFAAARPGNPPIGSAGRARSRSPPRAIWTPNLETPLHTFENLWASLNWEQRAFFLDFMIMSSTHTMDEPTGEGKGDGKGDGKDDGKGDGKDKGDGKGAGNDKGAGGGSTT